MLKIKRSGISLIYLIIIALLFSCSSESESGRDKIHVSAAASMTDALSEISDEFTRETGREILLSFASSSMSARQIKEGKQCSLFVSANEEWMDYLEDLYIPETKEVLLNNTLVLIAPLSSSKELDVPENLLEWEDLKIAMGDPTHVPAGIYGKSLLENLGLWDSINRKVVGAMDVRAALALVESGSVDMGIVYRTDALTSKKVKILYDFPIDSHRITYPVCLFDEEEGSIEFYDYLFNSYSRSVFKKYGFLILPGDKA